MTMAETREIKERMSLETVNMSRDEFYKYYSEKYAEAQEAIERLRDANNIAS